MRRAQLLAILLASGPLALATPALAAPEQLKGMNFIDVMSGNTVSGTTPAGAAFNLYFVDGGDVSYEDSAGEHDNGRWLIDPEGDVCITWRKHDPGHQSCYRVSVDGDHVTWQGKAGSGEALLRGGVGESFLKHP
jgi:hypothetical protein